MTTTTLDEARLKSLVKEALVEVLQERGELVADLLAELVEDVVLDRAIEEVRASDNVSRDEVFRELEADT